MREAFSLFDYDRDDHLSAADVGTALRSLGQNLTQDEVNKLQDEVKTKHSGFEMHLLCNF